MPRRNHINVIRDGEKILLDEKEWRILNSIRGAWTIRELARLSGVPYSTVNKVLERFRRIAHFKFRAKYRDMGLLPLHVFAEGDGQPPPYTLMKSRLHGAHSITLYTALVPVALVDTYLESLEDEPLAVVRGYELRHWEPSPRFNVYSDGVLRPRYGFYEDVAIYSAPVEPYSETPRPPDKVDLMIISMKMADPFMRPSTIMEHALEMDSSLPRLSSQTLSYHTVHHVKERLWDGNAACLCLERAWKVPRRVFYIEGERAPLAARMLVNLPGFSYAALDVGKAIVVGYPLCGYFEEIYRLFTGLGVKMPFGDLVDDRLERRLYVPMLWRMTEHRRWIWPNDPPRPARGTVFEEAEFF